MLAIFDNFVSFNSYGRRVSVGSRRPVMEPHFLSLEFPQRPVEFSTILLNLVHRAIVSLNGEECEGLIARHAEDADDRFCRSSRLFLAETRESNERETQYQSTFQRANERYR